MLREQLHAFGPPKEKKKVRVDDVEHLPLAVPIDGPLPWHRCESELMHVADTIGDPDAAGRLSYTEIFNTVLQLSIGKTKARRRRFHRFENAAIHIRFGAIFEFICQPLHTPLARPTFEYIDE